MPRGAWAGSVVLVYYYKYGLSLYISREKGDHYYILTRHNDLFSDYNLIYNFKKCNVFMPPHPPGILGIL